MNPDNRQHTNSNPAAPRPISPEIVARLAPCPMCRPSSPARYALGVGARCGGWFASRWRTTPPPRVRPHQQLAPSSSALSHEPISQVLSREAPEKSQHACAFGDVVSVYQRNRYPLHYRAAFASSLISYPHRRRSALRLHFPLRGAIRAYPVSLK